MRDGWTQDSAMPETSETYDSQRESGDTLPDVSFAGVRRHGRGMLSPATGCSQMSHFDVAPKRSNRMARPSGIH